ncbi:MAG TPA: IPExxxVDY family protein [Bacteroidales bacterium]|nr:IPExxxVDY family protein [Bacteroidales bacterium]
MKKTKKITRINLKDNQYPAHILIGLVSPEPDYKLSLLINKKLRISLKNSEPVQIAGDKKQIIFSRFSAASDDSELTYSLVSNRCEKEYLIRKLKNIDYIFVLHSHAEETDIESLTANLRLTESVTAALRINHDELKDKNIQYLIH